MEPILLLSCVKFGTRAFYILHGSKEVIFAAINYLWLEVILFQLEVI